ncbi:hypothetical protein [Methanosarcina acetivorans]|uniref:Uncharacterized protein n=1 Tax=Methanosarcina acetivorans (strain ATCC 35395 / DSM 2834 / JCM 12185 / C2A) TaxID=188937 RepID=Q8TMR8_METAC|nr:hypothetical protein [Methanosarcina acetivorans]AAM05966.1 predicted protein [Methanosarcina acetivorans C2A]
MELKDAAITIVLAAIVLSVGAITVFGLDNSDTKPEYVTGLAVFVNDDGTEATHVRGAIYNEAGYMVATTPEYEIVGDSWNIMYFNRAQRISTSDSSYILAIQGDGTISVPTTGEDYIFEEATYGTFPGSLEDISCADDLSIYALYQ